MCVVDCCCVSGTFSEFHVTSFISLSINYSSMSWSNHLWMIYRLICFSFDVHFTILSPLFPFSRSISTHVHILCRCYNLYIILHLFQLHTLRHQSTHSRTSFNFPFHFISYLNLYISLLLAPINAYTHQFHSNKLLC